LHQPCSLSDGTFFASPKTLHVEWTPLERAEPPAATSRQAADTWSGVVAPTNLTTARWLVAFPGLAVMLTAMSVNTLATWTRAITDPVQHAGSIPAASTQATRAGGAIG
jgi:hypothetical protein